MRSPDLTRSGLIGICALLLLTVASFGQGDQARFSGTVRDQSGAVIPGATVTVRNERTGEERTATSTQDGNYAVANLKPSTYPITAVNHHLQKPSSLRLNWSSDRL